MRSLNKKVQQVLSASDEHKHGAQSQKSTCFENITYEQYAKGWLGKSPHLVHAIEHCDVQIQPKKAQRPRGSLATKYWQTICSANKRYGKVGVHEVYEGIEEGAQHHGPPATPNVITRTRGVESADKKWKMPGNT